VIGRAIPLKITSLLVALILAYAVHSARNASVVSLFVPIEVKNAPEDKAIVKPVKRGVQVTLKGPSFLIGPVASSPPPLRIKLPDTEGDRVAVTFKAADIDLPSSIEVLGIEPAGMEFVFEKLERQDLRVEVPRTGQLSKDLVLESIEVAPKFVSVRGPQSDVKLLKSIEAEPIHLSEINSSTEVTLSLRSLGASVSPSTRTVVAKVTIGQKPTEKIFLSRPLELRVSSGVGGLVLSAERANITVSGSPAVLANVSEQDIIPFVRVTEALEKSITKKIEVDLPQGLKVVSVEPSSIGVGEQEPARVKSGTKKR
jgi:YbbR domain-containing protein